MKTYNIDADICRKNSGCTKYDAIAPFIPKGHEVIPLWIADMDFATPPFVLDAIRKRLEHPVLGYSIPTDEYKNAVINWMKNQYNMEVSPEEFCYTPGIVSGIYKLLQFLTDKTDGVLICPPVYPPFSAVIRNTERTLVEAPLKLENNRFEVDFDLLDEKLKSAKVMIWCHPHNPGGRVWSQEECAKVVKLCRKHNVMIICDEIHADLTFTPKKHQPMVLSCPEAAQCVITLQAPSKAFNMPGVVGSQLIVLEPELRQRLFPYLENSGLQIGNSCAFPAIASAYNNGKEWLDDTLRYIQDNIAYVREFLSSQLPMLEMIEPEASFLIFINFKALNLSDEELNRFLLEDAGVMLNPGITFGTGGEGWMRLNIGTTRKRLEQAMEQIKRAVDKLLSK